MKKYEFTGKEKKYFGRTLKQIVCVTEFAVINVGDVGGWIESEYNLDQAGDRDWETHIFSYQFSLSTS